MWVLPLRVGFAIYWQTISIEISRNVWDECTDNGKTSIVDDVQLLLGREWGLIRKYVTLQILYDSVTTTSQSSILWNNIIWLFRVVLVLQKTDWNTMRSGYNRYWLPSILSTCRARTHYVVIESSHPWKHVVESPVSGTLDEPPERRSTAYDM